MTYLVQRDRAAVAMLTRVGAALYGPAWHGSMARALGVSDRLVRDWLAGDAPIPAGVLAALPGLIEEHRRMLARLITQVE